MQRLEACGKCHLACAYLLATLLSMTGASAKLTTLYAFRGGNDGQAPYGGVIEDKAGNLYGTTGAGDRGTCLGGCGTVFKVAPDGTGTTLHAFTGGKDGGQSQAGLMLGADGQLYGTTTEGGKYGYGTVFKLRK